MSETTTTPTVRSDGRDFMATLLEKRERKFGEDSAVEFARRFLKPPPDNEREAGFDDACREYLAEKGAAE